VHVTLDAGVNHNVWEVYSMLSEFLPEKL